jgi:proteasome lid subunit RPN8/RPN11
MDDANLAALRAHAAREAPRECCGVLVVVKGRERYRPCRNLAGDTAEFAIDPADWAAAEDAGEIVAVCHSHVNYPAEASMADRAGVESTGLPWVIVNHPTGAVQTYAPHGYRAPLVGRPFCHGVLDCYSLVRDYYARELSIALPDFAREERWWQKGGNLYIEHFADAGFVAVADVRVHDVLLMQVQSSVVNHAAVMAGDNVILHHLMGRLSSRDVYGGWFHSITRKVVRHRSLI